MASALVDSFDMPSKSIKCVRQPRGVEFSLYFVPINALD
jgi:hypothetical protein